MYAAARFCFALTSACAFALACACNGTEAPKPEMAAPLTRSDTPNSKVTPATPGAPEPAPELHMQVVRSNAGVGLRVINAGRSSTSLGAQVTLEALRDDKYEPVANQTLTLQLDCRSTGCVTLSPGAEIDAPTWLEQIAAERCGALLVPPHEGAYRLRVKSCGGSHSRDVAFTWPVQ